MNSSTCSVQLAQVTSVGSVTVNVCGPLNAPACASIPSASTGNTGGLWITVEPQGSVPTTVTGGSAGNPLWPVVDSTTR